MQRMAEELRRLQDALAEVDATYDQVRKDFLGRKITYDQAFQSLVRVSGRVAAEEYLIELKGELTCRT